MKLNQYIDHTILKPAATAADVEAICREAVEYEFASVCVNTCHVRLVSRLLSGSPVKTCVVVGFPLGAMATEAKAFEAKHAVSNGAQEVDMVLNVGALKERNDSLVEQDIRAVKEACGSALLKVIWKPVCSAMKKRNGPAAWRSRPEPILSRPLLASPLAARLPMTSP